MRTVGNALYGLHNIAHTMAVEIVLRELVRASGSGPNFPPVGDLAEIKILPCQQTHWRSGTGDHWKLERNSEAVLGIAGASAAALLVHVSGMHVEAQSLSAACGAR